MIRRLFSLVSLVLLMLGFNLTSVAQLELRKVIPLSPNAAEIQKYIDAPVNYFTGIPSISIPVYTITAGDLSLPLSLSYHAGGNKVEGLATWVGLSWNLGSIPSISRSVNGAPDDGPGGTFNTRYRDMSYYDLAQLGKPFNDRYVEYKEYLNDVQSGIADLAPDIFSYSINGASGRFYYSTEHQRFITSPLSNVKITFENGTFTIVGEDGVIYYFPNMETETTISNSTTKNIPVVTTWMVSTIQNAAKTETIKFNYVVETTVNHAIVNDTKFIYLEGEICPEYAGKFDYNGVTIDVAAMNTKRLTSIDFRGGTVKFVPVKTDREDLINGHALDSIIVLNERNETIKQCALSYHYMGGGLENTTSCLGSAADRTNKWLMLSEYKEVSSNKKNNVWSFEYDEKNNPSCRNSVAQDYWGFYNGQNSNKSLIPTTKILFPSMLIPGADRSVGPAYSQFGIMKKMTFPTGGYREFDYENNMVYNTDLPAVYTTETANMQANSGEFPDGESQLPKHAEFTVDFTINNPPDKLLNNSNANGGAYLTLQMGELGVPMESTSVNIYCKRISNETPAYGFGIFNEFKNQYIPNGTYRVTAIFDQDPPKYGNFYAIFTWGTLDKSVSSSNTYVGGLRVKEIRTYEHAGEIPLTSKYRYTTSMAADSSSGDIFSNTSLNYSDLIDMTAWCQMRCYRLQSFSTQQQVSFSGSVVGYKKIFVTTASPEQTGMTAYAYTFSKDQGQGDLPHPPLISKEEFRGQLQNQDDYQFKNNKYQLVKSATYDYIFHSADELTSYGIKADPDQLAYSNARFRYPFTMDYFMIPNWSALIAKTERTYDLNDVSKYIETKTEYTYNDHYHLKEATGYSSKGDINRAVSYYPYELTLTGNDEVARQNMLAKNMVGIELKKENFINTKLLSTVNNNFQVTSSGVRPRSIEVTKGASGAAADAVDFISYDTYGNILEQRKRNDVMEVYVWGYSNLYPVAKIIGSDYNTVKNLVNLSIINAPGTTDAAMRAELDKIRKGLANTNAQVMTYTYKPLTGVTSETDVRGNTVFYEYDGFGRLILVRDKDGNILKKYAYVLNR